MRGQESARRAFAPRKVLAEVLADRLTPVEFQKLVTRTTAGTRARVERLARETEGQQNYWRYGLMLLMATLVVEAFVGSR